MKIKVGCHWKGWALPLKISYQQKNIVLSILCFGVQLSWAKYPMETY